MDQSWVNIYQVGKPFIKLSAALLTLSEPHFRVVVLACCSLARHTQGLTQRKKKWEGVGDWRKVVTHHFLWPYHGTNGLFLLLSSELIWLIQGYLWRCYKAKLQFLGLFATFICKKRKESTKFEGKGSEMLQESQSFNTSIVISVGQHLF